MSTLREKQLTAAEAQENHLKEADRMNQIYAAVLSTDDGRAMLSNLIKQFNLVGRTFLPGEKGDVNALRAAVRDGERSVVNYMIQRARAANKDFPIPL